MIDRVKQLREEIQGFVPSDMQACEEFKVRMLGKKGRITELFTAFREVSAEQKKEFGQLLNEIKNLAQENYEQWSEKFALQQAKSDIPDLSLPGNPMPKGTRHPLSIIRNEILAIFQRLGFVVYEGPDIEDDWHNFSALNFAPEHPARDMQDTFFIERNPDIILRTHTSSVQVRVMEKQKPPIRGIMPGRVYRNEAISARAHCMFHQVEGIYVDKGVSFADLRQTLLYFAKEFFGADSQIRLRPSYFPFTEPSAEMDVSCSLCHGKGCNVCKYTGWLEVLGCGMVHPNVLKASSIDPDVYTGFAFGMGIERITMLRYGIRDLRMYFENDIRFLSQITR